MPRARSDPHEERAVRVARHLERSGSLLLIFGAFFAVTLPLVLLRTVPNFFSGTEILVLAQAWGLGTTHFLVTGVLYLRLANRQWMASSALRRTVFLAGPVLIFLAYGAIAAGQFEERAPALAASVFTALRIFDFTHVGRQSFGILQLLNLGGPARARGWRRLENVFFLGMAALQMLTVLGDGRFDSEPVAMRILLPAVSAIFLTLLGSHAWRILRRGPQRSTLVPAGYWLLQAVSAALAVWRTELYTIALSMHYVEYHVMMAPRCFSPPLDARAMGDRMLAWLGQRRVVFAAGLLAAAFAFGTTRHVAEAGVTSRFVIHAFDGLFLTHFLVEALLWRFHEPTLRSRVASLYFEPRMIGPRASAGRMLRGALAAIATLCLLGALLVVPAVRVRLEPLWTSLSVHYMDPSRASFHLNFAIQLALEERYDEALAHAEVSRAALPQDPGIRDVTEMIRGLRERSRNGPGAP